MSKGLVVSKPGGPEAMVWSDLETTAPGAGEVTVRHTAIGVNFIDVYFRTGLYPWPAETMIPGAEAAGVIEAVGPGVDGLSVGDRVAYIVRNGAYRESRTLPAAHLVRLPDAISDEVAASVMLKGLTAQYLVTSSYPVKAGDTVLVHAAAGGVGLLVGQWLKALGATTIGTAGSVEKLELARKHGYDHVINYRDKDFVAAVREITAGRGCEVVYDSVGADTWRGSLESLKRFGMFVNFGQSSGVIRDFALSDLAKGSLSACRPTLFDYIADREGLERRTADLFARLTSGEVRADTITRRPLRDAASVHADLEARRTVGATVLVP